MVEEKVEGIEEILKKSAAEIDVMAKERGLDPSDYHNIEELATAILEKPEGEKIEEKTEEEPEEPEEIDELSKKPRDELNTIAEEKGLDPDDYPNKKEIARAILEN